MQESNLLLPIRLISAPPALCQLHQLLAAGSGNEVLEFKEDAPVQSGSPLLQ